MQINTIITDKMEMKNITYKPFGIKWKMEMKKVPKEVLIEMIKTQGLEKEKMQELLDRSHIALTKIAQSSSSGTDFDSVIDMKKIASETLKNI